MSSRALFILLCLTPLFLMSWGGGTHRFINDRAVDHLPPQMFFFADHRAYFSQHASDPDFDNDPGNYHYIDIDYYPEFFTGQLPHQWQAMIDRYGQSTIESQGVVPWVIEWWLDELTTSMRNHDWTSVWQVAAELGHYVGDSHQALHLTVNYNGGETGNYGIHSRYETYMMNPHLGEITLKDSIATYWDSPIDSVFAYIEDIYPLVKSIMEVDDRAYYLDSNHGDTYYDIMWRDLGDATTWSIERAVIDLASIWYTAWINAGKPYPDGVVSIDEPSLPAAPRIKAYPNPFNSQITLKVNLPVAGSFVMRILDIQGNLLNTLISGEGEAGEFSIIWDGLDQNHVPVSSGVYFGQVITSGHASIQKLILIK